MRWFKRLWCRHPNVEARTYIANDGAPLVWRDCRCADCGSHIRIDPLISSELTAALLAEAEKLAPGEKVEV